MQDVDLTTDGLRASPPSNGMASFTASAPAAESSQPGFFQWFAGLVSRFLCLQQPPQITHRPPVPDPPTAHRPVVREPCSLLQHMPPRSHIQPDFGDADEQHESVTTLIPAKVLTALSTKLALPDIQDWIVDFTAVRCGIASVWDTA